MNRMPVSCSLPPAALLMVALLALAGAPAGCGTSSNKPPDSPPTTAATRAVDDQPRLEVVSVHLAKPLPQEIRRKLAGRYSHLGFADPEPATSMVVLLLMPQGQHIVAMDPGDIRVTTFADDRGTDLTTGQNIDPRPRSMFPNNSNIGPGGSGAYFELWSPQFPAADARELQVKGRINLLLADETRMVELQNAPLDLGATLKAGDVTLTIRGVQENPNPSEPMSLIFDVEGPKERIRKVRFIDRDGQEVGYRDQFAGVPGKESQFYFVLFKHAKALTIQVEYYTGLRHAAVPMDVRVRLGL